MSSAFAQLTAGLAPQELVLLKDENHDKEIYTCAVVFTILTIVAVFVRVTSRHMKKVACGIDDVLIVIALVVTTAQTVFICVGVKKYGLGRHLWTLNLDQIAGFHKLWYTVGTLQYTALMLTKISLLILFHRVFATPTFRNTTKFIGIIVILWWVGTILADTLICIPIEHNWNPGVPAHCGDKHLLAILPPIPWIATDLAILLMPMPVVYKLHLPVLQRIGLAVLFLLGGLAMISSCVRYSTLFFQRSDVTYHIVPATIWTIIEADLTIISACLIVSRPWFMKLYPSKMIKLVKKRLSRQPCQRSGGQNDLLGSLHHPIETLPAVYISLGAHFEFDLEKNIKTEYVNDNRRRWSYPDQVRSPCRPIATKSPRLREDLEGLEGQ